MESLYRKTVDPILKYCITMFCEGQSVKTNVSLIRAAIPNLLQPWTPYSNIRRSVDPSHRP